VAGVSNTVQVMNLRLGCQMPRVFSAPRRFVAVLVVGYLVLLLFGCGGSQAPNPQKGTGSPPAQQSAQHSVRLSWSPTNPEPLGYNVYRGTRSGGPYSKLNSEPIPSAGSSDTSVRAGAAYFYVVTSLGINSVESEFSNEVMVKIPQP